MNDLKARIALYLGVAEDDIMHYGENAGKAVVILNDFRKTIIPVADLPELGTEVAPDPPAPAVEAQASDTAGKTKARKARPGR